MGTQTKRLPVGDHFQLFYIPKGQRPRRPGIYRFGPNRWVIRIGRLGLVIGRYAWVGTR